MKDDEEDVGVGRREEVEGRVLEEKGEPQNMVVSRFTVTIGSGLVG